jgi:hypothetical protein
MKRSAGQYKRTLAGSEEVSAFVPLALPPRKPVLVIDERIGERLRASEHALGRLDLAGKMVPSLDWFPYAFVRKEAVISSQIEGTQATLIDLLTFEVGDEAAPDEDVAEVCNYVDALSYVRAELARADGLPLSVRLLNEAHRRLMHGARGSSRQLWRGAANLELDRRQPTGQCRLCAAARPVAAGPARRSREAPPCGGRPAPLGEDRLGPRAV